MLERHTYVFCLKFSFFNLSPKSGIVFDTHLTKNNSFIFRQLNAPTRTSVFSSRCCRIGYSYARNLVYALPGKKSQFGKILTYPNLLADKRPQHGITTVFFAHPFNKACVVLSQIDAARSRFCVRKCT